MTDSIDSDSVRSFHPGNFPEVSLQHQSGGQRWESGQEPRPLDLFGCSRPELERFVVDTLGERSYRAQQIFDWIYRKRVSSFTVMSNLSATVRERVAAAAFLPDVRVRERQISSDGTRKFLVEVDNGAAVETVLIKQPTRLTLCVSSQVGCAMGCSFCRTATMGLKRNLSTSEIIRQVQVAVADTQAVGDSFSNVVFMGMGEPLHNLENVIRAVAIMTDQFGFGIAPRRITVSTVGLVPAIARFGAECDANLAVSLNATTDEVRSQIMPVNRKYPLRELLGVLRRYPLRARRAITIEYVMLAGINDTADDLERLPQLLDGIDSKVNLIPYNENAGLGFRSPSREWVYHWQSTLKDRGVLVTTRWSKGVDISAACGQLATASGKKDPIPALTRGSN